MLGHLPRQAGLASDAAELENKYRTRCEGFSPLGVLIDVVVQAFEKDAKSALDATPT